MVRSSSWSLTLLVLLLAAAAWAVHASPVTVNEQQEGATAPTETVTVEGIAEIAASCPRVSQIQLLPVLYRVDPSDDPTKTALCPLPSRTREGLFAASATTSALQVSQHSRNVELRMATGALTTVSLVDDSWFLAAFLGVGNDGVGARCVPATLRANRLAALHYAAGDQGTAATANDAPALIQRLSQLATAASLSPAISAIHASDAQRRVNELKSRLYDAATDGLSRASSSSTADAWRAKYERLRGIAESTLASLRNGHAPSTGNGPQARHVAAAQADGGGDMGGPAGGGGAEGEGGAAGGDAAVPPFEMPPQDQQPPPPPPPPPQAPAQQHDAGAGASPEPSQLDLPTASPEDVQLWLQRHNLTGHGLSTDDVVAAMHSIEAASNGTDLPTPEPAEILDWLAAHNLTTNEAGEWDSNLPGGTIDPAMLERVNEAADRQARVLALMSLVRSIVAQDAVIAQYDGCAVPTLFERHDIHPELSGAPSCRTAAQPPAAPTTQPDGPPVLTSAPRPTDIPDFGDDGQTGVPVNPPPAPRHTRRSGSAHHSGDNHGPTAAASGIDNNDATADRRAPAGVLVVAGLVGGTVLVVGIALVVQRARNQTAQAGSVRRRARAARDAFQGLGDDDEDDDDEEHGELVGNTARPGPVTATVVNAAPVASDDDDDSDFGDLVGQPHTAASVDV